MKINEKNSQILHLVSRLARSADVSLDSDASSDLHRQIYTARALMVLNQIKSSRGLVSVLEFIYF